MNKLIKNIIENIVLIIGSLLLLLIIFIFALFAIAYDNFIMGVLVGVSLVLYPLFISGKLENIFENKKKNDE